MARATFAGWRHFAAGGVVFLVCFLASWSSVFAQEPRDELLRMARNEMALRFQSGSLQLTLRIRQSPQQAEEAVVAGFASDGALRLSRRTYGFRHSAHGLSVERTQDNPIRAESVHFPDWVAEYTNGSLEEGSSFNSAMLVAADTPGRRDRLSSELRQVTRFSHDLRLIGLTIKTPTSRVSKDDWSPVVTEQSIVSFFENASNITVATVSEREIVYAIDVPAVDGTLIPTHVGFQKIGADFRLTLIEMKSVSPQGTKRFNRVKSSFEHEGKSVATTFPRTVVIESGKDDTVTMSNEIKFEDEQWNVSFDADHFTLKSLRIPDGVFLRVFGAPLPEFLAANAPTSWNEISERKDFRLASGVAIAFFPEGGQTGSVAALESKKYSNARFWLMVGNFIFFLFIGVYLIVRRSNLATAIRKDQTSHEGPN